MAENLGIQGNNLSSASFSAEELLSYLAQNGKIDLNSAEEEMRKSQMDQILDQHPYAIYQGSNGRWYTYLPDDTKKNRRRKIERTSEEDIKHALYEFYTGIAEHKKLEAVTIEGLDLNVRSFAGFHKIRISIMLVPCAYSPLDRGMAYMQTFVLDPFREQSFHRDPIIAV